MTKSELKDRLSKSLEYLESELMQIRTSRATPSLLEGLLVEAYGSTMTLREVGSITSVDTHTLLVSPWDKSLLDSIATAVRNSDLNVNPIVGGDSVRVPMPDLTKERREELARVVSGKVEECKTAVRNIRQEAMKDIEKAFSSKEIGEDAKFSQREEVENIVKEFVSQAEDLGDRKREDVISL
jgi:ribosome recycling factor